MYEDFGLYIDGQWRPASDGAVKNVYDPATEDLLGTIPSATAEDLDAAIAAARKGLKVWRDTNPWERGAIIRRVAELVRERVNVIAEIMSKETGKPLAEAVAETNGSADQFEWYAEETKRIYGQTIEGRTKDVRMTVIYQPVGVVAAFSAWNFPALLPEVSEEDPVAALEAGEAPELAELMLHNGTVYRWNRPIYYTADGRPHLRVAEANALSGQRPFVCCCGSLQPAGFLVQVAFNPGQRRFG